VEARHLHQQCEGVPDPVEVTRNTSADEEVALDAKGNVYGAEVGPRALKKYVRERLWAAAVR